MMTISKSRTGKKTERDVPGTNSFSHQHYVPILKWRQGEYQALLRLSSQAKDCITPLFEIPTEQWDFENEQPAKSLTDHLKAFGRRLKAKWGKRYCFIDSCYLDGRSQVDNGMHHVSWIFQLARENSCRAIPVIGFGREDAYLSAVREIVHQDKRGACFRLEPGDFDRGNLTSSINRLLVAIGVKSEEVDLIIDFKSIGAQSARDYAESIISHLKRLPMISQWRTVIVAGTAFPSALPSTVYRPSGTAKRNAWLGYKAMVERASEVGRIPTFGDYSVSHPITEKLDPRLIDPTAKIKYTTDDDWFIVVGEKVKENGRAQYAKLCQRIIKASPKVFAGAKYSWGDDYIANVKTLGTGGSSTWPSVGTNHHITKVVNDLASLHGL